MTPACSGSIAVEFKAEENLYEDLMAGWGRLWLCPACGAKVRKNCRKWMEMVRKENQEMRIELEEAREEAREKIKTTERQQTKKR